MSNTVFQNPSVLLNEQISDYNLQALLDQYQTATQLSLNCHHLGTVEAFDAATQTATAKINYTKTYFQYDPKTNSAVPVQIEYPVLWNCPVVCLGGSQAALTFPIAAGDECLILFNDRSLDNWLHTGAVGPLNSPRLHHLSDGIILVGLRSNPKALTNYDAARAVLRNGTAALGVRTDTSKVLITGSYPNAPSSSHPSLNTLLQNLMTELGILITNIKLITVTCASPGNPSSVPLNVLNFTTNATNLTAIATQIGGLLE